MKQKESILCKTVAEEQLEEVVQIHKYYIIYYFDQLIYGERLKELDLDNINEAFLFDDQGCLHIYRDGTLKGVQFTYKPEVSYIDEVQLGGRTTNVEKLHIRKVLDYDVDGQAYYAYTLPLRIDFKDKKEGKA